MCVSGSASVAPDYFLADRTLPFRLADNLLAMVHSLVRMKTGVKEGYRVPRAFERVGIGIPQCFAVEIQQGTQEAHRLLFAGWVQ